MKSSSQNFTKITLEDFPNLKKNKIGIVVSEWNKDITSNLLNGAQEKLIEFGIKNENIKGFNWASFNASSDINLRRELPKDGPVNVGLPEMDSYNNVEEEVIKLNNNFRNWVFSLKNEKHQQFYSRLEDLTKKKDIDEKN